MSPYLTVLEVADYLRTTPGQIYNLVSKRKIPVWKPTGRLLFEREAIDNWVREKKRPEPIASVSRFESARLRLRSLTTELTADCQELQKGVS